MTETISGTKTIKFIDRKHVRNNKFMNKKGDENHDYRGVKKMNNNKNSQVKNILGFVSVYTFIFLCLAFVFGQNF